MSPQKPLVRYRCDKQFIGYHDGMEMLYRIFRLDSELSDMMKVIKSGRALRVMR